jgi:hypothetical protein
VVVLLLLWCLLLCDGVVFIDVVIVVIHCGCDLHCVVDIVVGLFCCVIYLMGTLLFVVVFVCDSVVVLICCCDCCYFICCCCYY